ncbi:MAG TPA: FAD-dependent oxidoreductase [Desulfomonilaceae bacterium]|nr:FAD-dependent oxidoreductase [Desulfomonilaceae bacterium]
MNGSVVTAEKLDTRCCIAGGGPAGIMLGFLLARAGVDVVILEKHVDFFRDFRGDTIHPSTFQIVHELDLLNEFLKQPHQEVQLLSAQIGETLTAVADFTHLSTHCKFLGFMPQWDFLTFFSTHANNYAEFHLKMEAEVIDLIWTDGKIAGVRAKTPSGTLEVRSDLVIGADGRHSIVRQKAGLKIVQSGVPIDVLWFRLTRYSSDPGQVLFRADYGNFFLMIDRGDYFQCGLVIRKGAFDQIQQQGLPVFRDDLAKLVPFMRDRLDEIRDWNDLHILTVRVDRLRKWFRPGLLCIGDAAHAMSPVGGVGINLAIQDAVAAANILATPLRQGTLNIEHLRRVQTRRELPTRMTQRLQILIQDHLIERFLNTSKRMSPPLPVRLLGRWPFLRRIPARVVGIGFRPEHVRTPDLHKPSETPQSE